MPKSLTHKDGLDIHVITDRVTEPEEPPLYEVEITLIEREANGKTGDFIMIYPSGRQWWNPIKVFKKEFLHRWNCAKMHVLKEPAKENPFSPVPAGTRALPHASSAGFTKKSALKRIDKGNKMVFDFAIAAAEGRVRMTGFDIEFGGDDT